MSVAVRRCWCMFLFVFNSSACLLSSRRGDGSFHGPFYLSHLAKELLVRLLILHRL